MFTSLRTLGCAFFGLMVLAGASFAADTGTVQGNVKGPDGKPVKDAQVTVAARDSKATQTAHTNKDGFYSFKNLAIDSYGVSVRATGLAATTATDIKPKTTGALRLDFALKKQTGTALAGAGTKKKATHMVWIPAETGSNLGGRWVEVDDQGNTASAERVERTGGGTVRGLQSNSGASHGGD